MIGNLKVVLDSDLAAIYGAPTFCLNESVWRNLEKFPSDFLSIFQRRFSGFGISSAISKTGRRFLSALSRQSPVATFLLILNLAFNILPKNIV
jgi:hypothetical protein